MNLPIALQREVAMDAATKEEILAPDWAWGRNNLTFAALLLFGVTERDAQICAWEAWMHPCIVKNSLASTTSGEVLLFDENGRFL